MTWALSAAVAGLVVLALVPRVFGAPRPMVFVAWQSVSDAEREDLEVRWSLTERRAIGPGAFSYTFGDTTSAALAQLVAHPAVLATEGIDRRAGTVNRSAPLTERRGGLLTAPAWLTRVAKGAGAALLVLGLMLAAAGARGVWASRARDAWRAFVARPGEAAGRVGRAAVGWVQRGVPAASPGAAGLFRIVFMACVLAIVGLEPASQSTIAAADVAAVAGPYGLVVRWMAGTPGSLRVVDEVLLVSGALVLVGALTRAAFAVFVGAFLLWACAFTTRTTLHAVSALQLTLVCLLTARWGDAWSLDAWFGRGRTSRAAGPPLVASRRYGFAIWVPGFVLSLAYLAAAWAKVGGSPAWILNGTVRQHFLTDLDHAWTTWGPSLTAWPMMAVALSAGAIGVEALALSAAFVASARYRLAVGVAVLSLLVGFALFQGIVWLGWWVLLLGFLPWQYLVRGGDSAAPREAGVTPAQLCAVVGLLLLQCGASFVMRDFRPFISGYDMYATTHGPEVDNARGLDRVRVVAQSPDGWLPVPACDFELPTVDEAGDGAGGRTALVGGLAACVDTAGVTGPVRLDLDRQTYDWSTHTLQWRRRIDVVGPVSRAALPGAWPFQH